MKKPLPYVIKRLLIVIAIIAVISIIILISAQFFDFSLSEGFLITGVICLVIGVASFNGNGQLKRSEGLEQAASQKDEPGDSRKYFRNLGYGFLIFMFILGALLIVISRFI